MFRLRRWGRAGYRSLLGAGLTIGVVATLLGLFQDLSGGDGLWNLEPQKIVLIGAAGVVLFGALIVVRHELLLNEVYEIYGNEHARKLLLDGIPPVRDAYFSYVSRGDYYTAQRFWAAGIINVKSSNGRTDLHAASESGFTAIVRGLLERGADPTATDTSGVTALQAASARGHSDVIDAILQFDPKVDAQARNDGVSALYAAAANGHIRVVEKLLEREASLNLSDHSGITPIVAAIEREHWAIVRILLDKGARVNTQDSVGATPWTTLLQRMRRTIFK